MVENVSGSSEVGVGVYGSPLIELTSIKPMNFNQDTDSNYMVVFQCRVRPEGVRICKNLPMHWFIRDPEDIRPYGILISNK